MGHSKSQCAAELGMSKYMINKTLVADPEASRAWADGRNSSENTDRKHTLRHAEMRGDVGRPRTELSSGDIRLARKSAELGLNGAMIADNLGIGETTFYTLKKENADLHAAVKKGRSKAQTKLARTAYEVAVKDKNVTMLIFLLKTRLGYRDVSSIEHTGRDAGPMRIITEGEMADNTPEMMASAWNQVKDGLAILKPDAEEQG